MSDGNVYLILVRGLKRSSGDARIDGVAVPSREEEDRPVTEDNGGIERTRTMGGAPRPTTYFAGYSLLFPLMTKEYAQMYCRQ